MPEPPLQGPSGSLSSLIEGGAEQVISLSVVSTFQCRSLVGGITDAGDDTLLRDSARRLLLSGSRLSGGGRGTGRGLART